MVPTGEMEKWTMPFVIMQKGGPYEHHYGGKGQLQLWPGNR